MSLWQRWALNQLTCIEIQCQVSRVLRPIHGRGKFSNLSVVAGDILTAIDGQDVAGFPKNVLRHYLLGPVIVAVCRMKWAPDKLREMCARRTQTNIVWGFLYACEFTYMFNSHCSNRDIASFSPVQRCYLALCVCVQTASLWILRYVLIF